MSRRGVTLIGLVLVPVGLRISFRQGRNAWQWHDSSYPPDRSLLICQAAVNGQVSSLTTCANVTDTTAT
jgi:hypothetical protein